MYNYRAPVRDTRFVFLELFDFAEHYQSIPDYNEVTEDLFNSIIEEGAKFAENELAPINQTGDEEGAQWENGVVRTPAGFKKAWDTYTEAGWPSMEYTEAEGGQGLPESLKLIVSEYMGTANWSWNSYTGFASAGTKCLRIGASQELRDKVIPKYVSGEWLGTMCLTEPHCGTDLGMLRTKATPNDDGTYNITGTKIFITAGDHDFTENIIHLVLARLEGAPEGTKGISLFLVPKVNFDGPNEGVSNNVNCASIEKKMGIKGSATCVLNFDGSRGYLIGPENRGLPTMFPMMNTARVGTGLQGLCHAELGLQKSVAYAKDRLQMRSVKGPANPDGPADPIIVHPDVRRMLLTQKAIAEGGRMMTAHCTKLVDIYNAESTDEEARKAADLQLSFITPIEKAFLTELGFESANLGMQCYGGHGYIREWGLEQNVRDARIAMLYEGTTGIQALDLLGRKVLGTQGKAAQATAAEIMAFCKENADHPYAKTITSLLERFQKMTMAIGMKAMQDPDEVGAASVDFLMFSGYLLFAYYWAKAAVTAEAKLAAGTTDTDFYNSKVKTAEFFFSKMLPRVETYEASIANGGGSLMSMTEDEFLAHI